jgi:outer membrane lipoprotein SlyB
MLILSKIHTDKEVFPMPQARRIVSLLLIISLAVFAGSCERYHYEGAAAGGAIGGLAGALLDDSNPWRGGVIGAALGAVAGATLTEISARGSRQAAQTGRPVEYTTRTDSGETAVYRADPIEYDARTECNKVRERVWKEGRLVKDEVREICESDKTEARYMGEEDYDRDRGYEYERESYRRGGPPPWAPAHGYRAKHRYRYFPSSYIYLDVEREVYFYRSGGEWVSSAWLPRDIYLDRDDYVILEMDEERPYRYHRDVVERYPPGYRHER